MTSIRQTANNTLNPILKQKVIRLEENDLLFPESESLKSQNLSFQHSETDFLSNPGEAATSVDYQVIEGQHWLDHPYFQDLNPQSQERRNKVVPQETHYEAEMGTMILCQDFPEPGFQYPEHLEKVIHDPSPQPTLPLGEPDDQHLTIHEEPGPASPLPKSQDDNFKSTWEQEATEIDQELVTLLLKETEARWGGGTYRD